MKGIVLCKFDENKGYIPIKIFPPNIYSEDKKQLFKDIAKNAIGFGTNIQFNQFDIENVQALSRRFIKKSASARGGVEIYSLVFLQDNEFEIDREIVNQYIDKLLTNWDRQDEIIKEIYEKIMDPNFSDNKNYEGTNIKFDKNNISVKDTKPIKSFLFRDELIREEFDTFFAIEKNIPRNIIMAIGLTLILFIVIFGYDLLYFFIMFNFGVLFFSFIYNRRKIMRLSVGILSIFILYIIIGIILLIYYDVTLIVKPTFPDVLVHPHWTILSFLSGFLICIGLDRGKKVDKISTILGIIYIVIYIILYLLLPYLFI